MFKQLTAPDHVLTMQFSDNLTGEDARQAKTVLDAKLQKHPHMGAVVDITGLRDMGADALAPGIEADLDLLRHIGQFHHLAIVSDKHWPEALIGLMKPLLAKLELRLFQPAQRDEAIRWAAEIPAVAHAGSGKPAKPALRLLPTSKDDVLAFEIDGPLTAESVSGLVGDMKRFLDRHDKVRLLGHIKHMGGIDPTLFMQSGLLSMKLAAMKKVERYAVVGAPGWMNTAVKALDPILSDIEMRTFSDAEQAEAWAWIGAEPAKTR